MTPAFLILAAALGIVPVTGPRVAARPRADAVRRPDSQLVATPPVAHAIAVRPAGRLAAPSGQDDCGPRPTGLSPTRDRLSVASDDDVRLREDRKAGQDRNPVLRC